ncbi:PREDICTED: uncharacterized protein LOC107342123 [Acropora digitifera]|uniref:uncharacterized protein LOC107342123 n=1 Tax=Acropora digitifera TaxID=70779 RepID=UPI00077A9141|nr:PREDICTED: uncharacterized protein LOC107342123 [Acropora digitifera]
MRVNLAAEVLSASVAAVLRSFSPPDTSGTAKLCEMVDSFFYCLNVSSNSEHQRKRKPFLAQYSSLHDERFHWLETTFLGYLQSWLQSTKDRLGDFTANARSKMFLSWQTYEGLQITIHSVIEAPRFLLGEGMEYVLTERFCQDTLEEYFGNQHKLGRRRDNPDISLFGDNDSVIRIQRSISC